MQINRCIKVASNHIIPSGPKPSKSDKLYKDALSGDPESQVQLGYNYRKSGDTNEAGKWFFKALEQGYNYANFQIGLLKYAESVKANNDFKLAWEQAYPWYEKGANGGCSHCKYEINEYLDKQIATEENLKNEKNRKEGDSLGKQISELILSIIGIILMGAVGIWLLAGAVFINSITIPLLVGGYIIYKIYNYFR